MDQSSVPAQFLPLLTVSKVPLQEQLFWELTSSPTLTNQTKDVLLFKAQQLFFTQIGIHLWSEMTLPLFTCQLQLNWTLSSAQLCCQQELPTSLLELWELSLDGDASLTMRTLARMSWDTFMMTSLQTQLALFVSQESFRHQTSAWQEPTVAEPALGTQEVTFVIIGKHLLSPLLRLLCIHCFVFIFLS